jgi:hypothetical protein
VHCSHCSSTNTSPIPSADDGEQLEGLVEGLTAADLIGDDVTSDAPAPARVLSIKLQAIVPDKILVCNVAMAMRAADCVPCRASATQALLRRSRAATTWGRYCMPAG